MASSGPGGAPKRGAPLRGTPRVDLAEAGDAAARLDAALHCLAADTVHLRQASLTALCASLVALVLFLLALHNSQATSPGAGFREAIAYLVPVSAGIAMLAAGVYEVLRSRSDVLFDEISDELQWYLRERTASGHVATQRPSLEARVALREFAHAAEMPFLPGPHGPTICILLNIGLTVAAHFYVR